MTGRQVRTRGSIGASTALIIAAALPHAGFSQTADATERPVVVASKPFAESYILAEAFAQVLEAEGYTVDRRLGLAATEIVFQALRTGTVDVYPEYTGTALTAILGETPTRSHVDAFQRVSRVFAERWGIRWLPPLGFENTYAIALRRPRADSLGITTLSGLAEASGALRAGFSPDFLGRPDGLPGLAGAYGMGFADTRPLLQAVKYRALAEGEVDVIDAYSTDGGIARYDLAVMADDRSFFPPYDAAPLVGPRLQAEQPGAVLALSRLSGRIGVEDIRRANERVEMEGVEVAIAAAELLASLGLGSAEALTADEPRPSAAPSDPTSTATALPRYMWSRRVDLARQAQRHVLLVLVSLAAAVLLAVPLGMALERRRAVAEPAIQLVGVLQTVPGIALLAFMIPLLGIGVVPAVTALFLYSLLPILRNTYTGIVEADPAAVSAALALGMTARQVLFQIRLPLAVPTVMAGIRTAAVINVGTATLAAFIGAGGLGDPIVAGLALSDPVMILSGAVPAALLAILVDLVLSWAEGRARPAGIG